MSTGNKVILPSFDSDPDSGARVPNPDHVKAAVDHMVRGLLEDEDRYILGVLNRVECKGCTTVFPDNDVFLLHLDGNADCSMHHAHEL